MLRKNNETLSKLQQSTMDTINPESIDNYIGQHSSPEDEVLEQLNRETHLKVINPRMLSGHVQGKFLELISKTHSPLNILEIGTYTGYSSICLARGLRNNGYLHTIESNDELRAIQDKYFKLAGLSDKIKVHTGNALDIIPSLDIKFDMAFIDADKKDYCAYFHEIFDKITPGGIILSDNVLWSGKVADPNIQDDPETEALRKFNKILSCDPRIDSVIIPLRDGISMARKKN